MILAYPPSPAPFSPLPFFFSSLFSSPTVRVTGTSIHSTSDTSARRYTHTRVHSKTENTEDSKVSHQIRVGKSSWQVRERVSVLLFIYCLQGQSDNARNTGYICMSGAATEWRSSLCVLSGQRRRWIREGEASDSDGIVRSRNSVKFDRFETLCRVVGFDEVDYVGDG